MSKKHPVRGWQEMVWAACVEEIVRRELPRPCFTGAVSMSCEVYGARANADLDNLFKAIADAVNGMAYEDDRQISELIIRRRPVTASTPEGARIEIASLP